MITDRGKSYDAEEFKAVDQQKCLGHILRNITDVVETKQGRARDFGLKAKSLIQDGMELSRARDSLAPEVFTEKAGEIKDLVDYHLRDRVLTDDDNQCLLNGLGAYNDRGNLTRFLEEPFVEPTKCLNAPKTRKEQGHSPHSRASRKQPSRMARLRSLRSSVLYLRP